MPRETIQQLKALHIEEKKTWEAKLQQKMSDVANAERRAEKWEKESDLRAVAIREIKKELNAEQEESLRLKLLASEMRGFLMANFTVEVEGEGELLFKSGYGGDAKDNTVVVPLVRFPFMSEKI